MSQFNLKIYIKDITDQYHMLRRKKETSQSLKVG